MARYPKRVTLIAAALTAATLAAAVPVAWRLIEEESCIRKLDSPSFEERKAAAERLGEMKSARAVGKLVELLVRASIEHEVPQHGFWEATQRHAGAALIKIGAPAVAPLLERLERLVPDSNQKEDMERAQRDVTSVLFNLGSKAAGAFVRAVHDPRSWVRAVSVEWLGHHVNESSSVLECIVGALADSDEEVRLRAVQSLSAASVHSAVAIPLLLARLEDPTEAAGVRQWAAWDLPVLGAPAMNALRKELQHPDAFVRLHAAHALFESAPKNKREAIPWLRETLQSTDGALRHLALSDLCNTEHVTISELTHFLEDPVLGVRCTAVSALARRGPTRDALPTLLRLLREPPGGERDEIDSAATRRAAAEAVGKLGPDAEAAVPALIEALAVTKMSPDGDTRRAVVNALGRIGPGASAAVPALMGCLAAGGANAAVEALGRIGPAAVQATPELIRAKAPSYENEQDLIRAFVRIGEGTLPGVIHILKAKETSFRPRAIEIVAAFGPAARDAVPALIEILSEDDSNLRQSVVRALGHIGPEARAAIPHLLKLLEKNLAEGGSECAEATALGGIGALAKEAVPTLLKAADSEQDNVRATACLALGRIGVRSDEVLAKLRERSRDESAIPRLWAAIALGRLGSGVEALQRELADGQVSSDLDATALAELEGFSGDGTALLPALIRILEPGRDDRPLRLQVLKLICELGAEARPAVPTILGLVAEMKSVKDFPISFGDPGTIREEVIEAAEEALRRIESKPTGSAR